MAAYFIVEIEVTDPTVFEEYRKQVSGTIEKYGGRYVVRGGTCETIEGGWAPKRVIVLEFASVEQAKRWYNSPEYKPLLAVRLKSSTGKMILVEGT